VGFGVMALCALPFNALAETLPSGERSHGNARLGKSPRRRSLTTSRFAPLPEGGKRQPGDDRR